MTQNTETRIIGFDPGLGVTGYGIIEGAGMCPRIVEAGVIRVPTTRSIAARLDYLYRQAVEVIEEHQPTVAAMEELYSHYARPKTAILMGHARGALLLAAAHGGLDVAGYLPTRVKKRMTGSGAANKEQMQRAVQMQFALSKPPEPPDVADALAIALCHCYEQRLAG